MAAAIPAAYAFSRMHFKGRKPILKQLVLLYSFPSVISMFAIFLPGAAVPFASFISSSGHFRSIARGIIDSRDIIYFVSVTAVFVVLTVNVLNNARKG